MPPQLPPQHTGWGQRLIDVLETFTSRSRLQRGHKYATRKRIQSFVIDGSVVSAQIRGSVSPYYGVYTPPLYTTTLEFRAFSPERWQLALAEMTGSVRLMAQLMDHQIPAELPQRLAPLKIYLLPKSAIEITSDCSCPDWEDPCKHVAGLYYFLAAHIDRDPLTLLELRGLSRRDLIAALQQSPLGAARAEMLAVLKELDDYVSSDEVRELGYKYDVLRQYRPELQADTWGAYYEFIR